MFNLSMDVALDCERGCRAETIFNTVNNFKEKYGLYLSYISTDCEYVFQSNKRNTISYTISFINGQKDSLIFKFTGTYKYGTNIDDFTEKLNYLKTIIKI